MTISLRLAAVIAVVFSGTLPAADPRMASLVMPDAKVIAGVNLTQALASPFGQYALSLTAAHDPQLRAFDTLTGFDPRRDVTELLAATSGMPGGPGAQSYLVLARGSYRVDSLTAAATLVGAATETYHGAAVLKSQDGLYALAFLDSTLAVFGDVASVKAAIARQSSESRHLPPAAVSRIGQLSAANDAWVLTTVSPASLGLPQGAPAVPGMDIKMFGQVRQAALGVKFGANVTVTAQAQADTEQNATALAGILQLLANMAQTQAQKDPETAAFAKTLGISSEGATVSLSFRIPEAKLRPLIDSWQHGQEKAHHPAGHKSL